MKKILVATLLMIALTSVACQSSVLVENAKADTSPVDLEMIKNATILIVVKSKQGNDTVLDRSMATLVKIEDKTYLVTHNHYSTIQSDQNIVELRDAQDKLLLWITTYEFKLLIVYKDAGTIVLRTPKRLPNQLTPASLDSAAQLKPGDTVQIAYRQQPGRDSVDVLEAVVEDIRVTEDTPVYTLRNLNGISLYPGDSGGGVWLNGKLVANTWAAVTQYAVTETTGEIVPDSETVTDHSRAAMIPEKIK